METRSLQQKSIPGFPEYLISADGVVTSFIKAKPARLKPHMSSGYRRIAKQYGVAASTVGAIVRGDSWGWAND